MRPNQLTDAWKYVELIPFHSCWEWTGQMRGGYGRFQLQGRLVPATHVILRLVSGLWPTRFVLHRCDNPGCVNPQHLFEGTKRDNKQDCIAKGRHAFGVKNGRSKLRPEQIPEIKRLLALRTYTYRAIGAMFGVKSASIWQIDKDLTWREGQ